MRKRWEAASLALLCGCASGPRPEPDRTPIDKGTLPNGTQLNGTDLGGKVLQAVALARGVTLAGGAHLDDVRLEGTELRSERSAGADFTGAELIGETTDGTSVRLRVDRVAVDPAASPADLRLYDVSYQLRPGGPFAPLCPEGRPAIPLGGRWDYRHGMRGDGRRLSSAGREVTLACDGSAAAKCVRLGYAPWRTLERSTPAGPVRVALAPLHEACVRAIRADYCGNGESLTRPGETINLYDAAGIQADTESWTFEAEWTPAGARCVNDTRLMLVPGAPATAATPVREYLQRQCPSRFREADKACVADPAAAAAFLFTEYPPR